MKIQVITYGNDLANKFEGYDITYSTIHEPRSFDEFDINILSLQSESIWKNKEDSTLTIDTIADFNSIGTIIRKSQKCTTIVCYPQNIKFTYYYKFKDHIKYKELKDIISSVEGIVRKILPSLVEGQYGLIYENTKTTINQFECNAAFYFEKQGDRVKAKTRSNGGNKKTTISVNDNFYATTLDLSSGKFNLKDFLVAIGLDSYTGDIPQWLLDLDFFDDAERKDRILEKQTQISVLNDQISKEQEKLEENAKYKRVLVENGDPLVEIVFDMLEKMLDYDLSTFIDEKKQDFLIRKEKITFIGEIKGISSNVSYENVSQLERHYGSYLDELEKSGNNENVKMILIINPFRTKPLGDREPVHINQIKLAQKYGSLIITTEVLLALFEKFLNNSVSKEKIFDLLTNKVGILEKNDF